MIAVSISAKKFVGSVIAAVIIAFAGPAAAQAQTAITCEEAYSLIFGALNGQRPDGRPAAIRQDVPDGAVSWALWYEQQTGMAKLSCTPPDGILGAYVGVIQADNRRAANVAAAPITKAMRQSPTAKPAPPARVVTRTTPTIPTKPVVANPLATDSFGLSANDYYDLGKGLLLVGDLADAHKEFTTSCNMGHALACYEASGQGDANMEYRALAFWADGCRRGDPRACAKMDDLKSSTSDARFLIPMRLSAAGYAEKRQNYAEAKRIFSGICEEGFGRGCFDQARILRDIERSADKAAIDELMKRSCQLGYKEACS